MSVVISIVACVYILFSCNNRERLNVPQSLFWRHAHGDTLSTKLRRFGAHTKKMKSRTDQFSSLLEHLPVC